MAAEQALLSVRGLSKQFVTSRNIFTGKTKAVRAVNNVSFSIPRGKTLGLVGESGCGKSTLGRCVLRLIPKSSGSVLFEGTALETLSGEGMRLLRQKMQMIFQDPYACLNPRMNVFELVCAPLNVFKIGTRAQREEKVREILSIVGLDEHYLTRYPFEFSGGQRQRIGIARALVLNPSFVVCDEPVSALDVSVRAQVLNLMQKLQKRFGLAYLFISHDLSVVKHVSDSVAVMYLGNIVENAKKEQIYARPLHPYTQALLSAIPLPDTDHVYDRKILKGSVPNPYAPPGGCCFHTRCDACMERCRHTAPEVREVEENHFVACHLYGAKGG